MNKPRGDLCGQRRNCLALGTNFHAFPETLTIGIDLGDRFGHYCILDQKGVVVEEGRVKMTRKEVTVHFQRLAAARIAMEAGTHSGWVSRLLESFGHEVLVANVCETPGISHSHRKSDPRCREAGSLCAG
jgi:hypothetical protein